MTRKSKRELEREIEDLQDDGDGLGEIEVSSTVVTATEDTTPEVTVPDDATLLPTESDVVTVWSTTEPSPEE